MTNSLPSKASEMASTLDKSVALYCATRDRLAGLVIKGSSRFRFGDAEDEGEEETRPVVIFPRFRCSIEENSVVVMMSSTPLSLRKC